MEKLRILNIKEINEMDRNQIEDNEIFNPESTEVAKALGLKDDNPYLVYDIKNNNNCLIINNKVIRDDKEISKQVVKNIGFRPVIKYINLSNLNTIKKNNEIAYYGTYPQIVLNEEEIKLVEKKLKKGKLKLKKPLFIHNYNSYKYISDDNTEYVKINKDDNYTNKNDIIWAKCKSVEWIIDEKQKLLISKKILMSGCNFSFNKLKSNLIVFSNFANALGNDYKIHKFDNKTMAIKL